MPYCVLSHVRYIRGVVWISWWGREISQPLAYKQGEYEVFEKSNATWCGRTFYSTTYQKKCNKVCEGFEPTILCMIDKRFYPLHHRTDESVVKHKYVLYTSLLHTNKHIYEQYKVQFGNNNSIFGITTPRISLASVILLLLLKVSFVVLSRNLVL